ncbi:MAG: HD domain-containing protein, partial [Candidatus Dormibacteria bacterium]
LYPSLARATTGVPSEEVVVETLRLGGLLHDIGHGPFGHFFDEQYLEQFGITHETISQHIINGDLAPLISALEASPHGAFKEGERVDPRWVAYVISKEALPGFIPPRWLELLKPVLCGSFASDNMDYVPRDAYACGVSIGPVDVRRIIHYTFISPEGMALHQHGAEAMLLFLSSRMYLYTNLYHHRTVRRIDLHMREIFKDTIEEILGATNPLDDLQGYQQLNDWHLLNEVDRWRVAASPGSRRAALAGEWARITGRAEMKWKLAYEAVFEYRDRERGAFLLSSEEIRARLLRELHGRDAEGEFRVDVASLDARPPHPSTDRDAVLLYDPLDGSLRGDAITPMLERLPMRSSLVRLFILAGDDPGPLRAAANLVLGNSLEPAINTNT